jgi:hypothetical protein
MKRVDASRPGLSLPVRLGVLTLATFAGLIAIASLMAHQNGTDVVSSLGTLDFAKAYSKQNIDYTLAETKLKLGDRRGAAALVKTLPMQIEDEGTLSYRELRAALVKAQLAAGEFTEALSSAGTDKTLVPEVLTAQCQRQGLEPTLANAAALTEPDRSTALGFLASRYASQGELELSERIVAQLIPSVRESISNLLVTSYYRTGHLSAAIDTLQRTVHKSSQRVLLVSLGHSCMQQKDQKGLERVLALTPREPSQYKPVRIKNTGQVFQQLAVASPRCELLESAISQLEPPRDVFELIRTFAHPDDLPHLLRRFCSMQRGRQQGQEDMLPALALLRQQTTEVGKQEYDQEVQQFLYGDLSGVADPLALALSIHSEPARGQALFLLGQSKLNWEHVDGLEAILKAMRALPVKEAQQNHDALIEQALMRIQQSDPPRAQRLAQQLIDPERRKQLLARLTAEGM